MERPRSARKGQKKGRRTGGATREVVPFPPNVAGLFDELTALQADLRTLRTEEAQARAETIDQLYGVLTASETPSADVVKYVIEAMQDIRRWISSNRGAVEPPTAPASREDRTVALYESAIAARGRVEEMATKFKAVAERAKKKGTLSTRTIARLRPFLDDLGADVGEYTEHAKGFNKADRALFTIWILFGDLASATDDAELLQDFFILLGASAVQTLLDFGVSPCNQQFAKELRARLDPVMN